MSETEIEQRLYKSTMPFCTVTTTRGHSLHFKSGMFITSNPDYIEFLDKEIAANGFAGSIYIDPKARTISAEQANPMLALEKMFFEKFEKQRQEQMNPNQDRGESNQGKLNAGNTSSIAPVAAGAGPATSQAVALMAKVTAATATATPVVPTK